MSWNEGFEREQQAAIRASGSHIRLLAGPGTGKTWVLKERICHLIEHVGVDPDEILALTFTRAAARELHDRVKESIHPGLVPRISTLHSYALRQLLRNASKIPMLPTPLHIADDWEERNIIHNDLKLMLGATSIREIRELFTDLASNWQDLSADGESWEETFRSPRFLGAWREHRDLYGYTLRDELLYQLKCALEQDPTFDLEGPPRYVMVDEYQDLNQCDLALVRELARRGAEIFAAGDDDQSIYGFRKAYPEGIRQFTQDYKPNQDLRLTHCMRCSSNIVDLASFVAGWDHRRIPKSLLPYNPGGTVKLLRFGNQDAEATGVARICRALVDQGTRPDDILMLLRSDRNGSFSSVIHKALRSVDLSSAIGDNQALHPLLGNEGRQFYALVRLCVNRQDNLAWRTLVKSRRNGLGEKALHVIHDVARSLSLTFSEALGAISEDESLVPAAYGKKIRNEWKKINELLDDCLSEGGEIRDEMDVLISRLMDGIPGRTHLKEAIAQALLEVSDELRVSTVGELARGIAGLNSRIEPSLSPGKINILTMHKAKGLGARVVFVLGVEDERVPGDKKGNALDDELRLLYVSLTRAKEHLYITYCNKRSDGQQYSGQNAGIMGRRLTRFLADAPISPEDGRAFADNLSTATE